MGRAVDALMPFGAADAIAACAEQDKQAQSHGRRLHRMELAEHAWRAFRKL